ncbi:RHOMBOID-like protein 10, chloroplastic [Panicum virgatum]|uniref:Peptidase S54 rhomboid domain-containing protein n=1 Tax=Panicum virgatum TaxID=38727 RepID=A0A8T0W639_PANVG|nr:RHOMBOID-like protein 10, chloroplastic [Panicum virgatum]KAG2643822.1 hypothetical protein PVAP13_2KG349400 [Panicum virgatum]
MASWLLHPLPSFPWLPPPPPPGSSSGGRGGGGGGGDGGDWRPNVVAAFAGAQVGSALRRRFAGLLCSPEVRHLEALPKMDDVCFGGSHSFATHSILGLLGNLFPASYVCSFAVFNGNGSGGSGTYIGKGKVLSRRPRRIDSKKRFWTNVLLAINVLAYVAQVASQGKLLMWGAKINSLIDRGQFWRLATSSLLHANVTHLTFNCFSLNSIGPMVEMLTGPRRFIAVYFSSALAGSLMSYRCCESPAVGASGAIFGLVGAYAVYMWRHRSYFGNARESLEHIGRVVVLNMGMGLLSRGIDNWGHLGGLLGGVAVAWFLGPAWQYQHAAKDGRVVFKDRAPVLRLIKG